MTADINTSLWFKGTFEELYNILAALRTFGTENQLDCLKEHNCAYITSTFIWGKNLNRLTEEEIADYLPKYGGEINIEVGGPYGSFARLGDTGLFERLSEAAPSATFTGRSSGFISGADIVLDGELKNGKLYLTELYLPDEVLPEQYAQEIKKSLPLEQFCSLFHVAEEVFDDDCYDDFIGDAFRIDGFPDMDYDTFLVYCGDSEIEEDEYEEAIAVVRGLDLPNYEMFEEMFENDGIKAYKKQSIYDPVSRSYER